MTKYVKGCDGFYIARNFPNKYIKQLLDTGLDVLKTVSRKVVHNAAETTNEFIGKKNAYKIVKTKPAIDQNSRMLKK